jgi:cytochrome c oxidase cbb3-type subunit 3
MNMKSAVISFLTLLFFLVLLLPASCSEEKAVTGSDSDITTQMVNEGAVIFRQNCQVCHGEGGKGDICPSHTDKEWKYGNSDNQLRESISKGRPGGMPPWESKLGEEKIKKLILYLRSISEN